MRRHENHTGWGFCSHTRTVVAARFLWRSEVAPRRSRKWRVTYRIGFVPYFGAMWTPIRPVTGVNKWEQGLEPTETEVKNIQELGIEFSTPNSFRQLRRHDVRRVCERLLPSWAVAVVCVAGGMCRCAIKVLAAEPWSKKGSGNEALYRQLRRLPLLFIPYIPNSFSRHHVKLFGIVWKQPKSRWSKMSL